MGVGVVEGEALSGFGQGVGSPVEQPSSRVVVGGPLGEVGVTWFGKLPLAGFPSP